MMFFRYQNTKTLERHSFKYVDMNSLYSRAVSHIDIYKESITIDSLADFLKDYTYELCYRQNLEKNDYGKLIREISKICLKYYAGYENIELRKTYQQKARTEIDDLMKPYPLRGLFVIPEYSILRPNGTKFSISELRSNIVTPLCAESAKYLAIYEGEVICEEMEYGGTLIKPTKLVNVFDLFEEKDKSIGYRHIFYRDIEDKEELKELIEENREWIHRNIDWNMSNEYISNLIKVHSKEILLNAILRYLKANYKSLDYRNINNIHCIKIIKDYRTFIIHIPEENITIDDFINHKTIIHKCKIVTKDLNDNIVKENSITLNVEI